MPLLLEPDAEFLTLNYDALSPENQAKAKEWLGNYKQQQYDKGEPLFPTQEKASIEKKLKLRGMFEAPEKIDYDPGPMSANPAMDRMQYANMALLSQRYQKEPREVSERYDLLMNDYTRQNFGVGETVDTAKFYALAQKEFQRMKQVEDTSLEGAKAALRGEDVIKSLQAWQAKNLDRIPDSTEFTKGYLNASEAVGDFVPMAKELLGELEAGFFKTKEGKRPRQESPDKLRDLTLELAQMKGRDRKQVYAALGAQIEAAGYDQKGFWAQTLGFLGKNVASMGQRLNRQALGVAITAATTPPASINDEFGFGPSSEEEFPQLAEEGRLAMELNDKLAEVESEIAGIVSGDLDPVKATTGWMNETFEKGLIKAPGATLPSMTIIGTLGPFAGGAVIAADFAESNRTELIAQGFDPQDAKRIGAIAAPMQAAVESLSNMFQLGRFPAVTAALSRFTRPVGGASLIGRYAQNTLIAGGTETAEDLTQDQIIVPIVTAIDQDTQIGFGKIWENIKTQTPELLSVTLPMALVFGGKMTAADAKLSGVMTQDIDGLKSLGYSEAQAITVVSEKTELDRIKKASSLWDSRAGNKVTIQTGAKNLAERMRQLSGDVMAQQQELERRGKLPILRPMVDGKWLMTIPSDGSAATFNTHQEADAARWTWAEDQLGKVHALTRETLATMEKNLAVGREVAVEFVPEARFATAEELQSKDFQERIQQGEVLGDISPDAAFEDAEAIDKATAEADGFISSTRILGSSKNEFKNGILRTTIKLWEGSNILTLVEEKLEGDAKVILSEDKGRNWMLSRLRRYESESGDKLFAVETDDKVTNKMIVEAWSHLGQSYLVGRSTFGEPLQKKAMRRFGRLLMRSGLTGAMNAESSFFAAVASRAQKLGELKQTGKLGDDLVSELEKQLGIDSQVSHNAVAEEVGTEIVQKGIDTSGYSPETPGPNGETFSVQARAKAGGEIGPNGEWYKGGAFIATTELPKKQRDKLSKMVGDGLVEVSKGVRKRQTPGMFSPYRNLVGVAMGPNGNLNEDYLSNDRNNFAAGYVAQVRDAALRWSAGEMQLPISEFPLLVNATDLARTIDAKVAISGEVLSRNVWAKEFVESYSPVSTSRAIPADASKIVQMPDGAQLVGPTTFSIRAYHGTPHKVDKFTTAKIGTGEGAQAYGWGLYFAEALNVAKTYSDTLGMQVKVKGKQVYRGIDGKTAGDAPISNGAIGLLSGKDWNLKEAQKEASERAAEIKDDPWFQRLADELQTLNESDIEIGSGNIYTVELLPDESEFLDWDKPLSEQRNPKLDALKKQHRAFLQDPAQRISDKGKNGDSLYWMVVRKTGSEKAASEMLAKAGIPGIRYADGQSRVSPLEIRARQQEVNARKADVERAPSDTNKAQLVSAENALADLLKKDREGTRNYVIFDENLVSILEENGKPVEGETFSLGKVTPAQDAEYLAAVEDGDMEKAQRMVDEAAKAAGYDAGTDWRYTISLKEGWRRAPTIGEAITAPALFGKYPFLAKVRFAADSPTMGGRSMSGLYNPPQLFGLIKERVRVNPARPLPDISRTIFHEMIHAVQRAEKRSASAVADEREARAAEVQVKLSDPITRDNDGNVIPLSKRFNPADNRITYSIRPGDFAARMEAKFSLFQAKPELRLAIAQVAKERALRLGAEWIAKGDVIRSAKDIGKEQAFREADGFDRRMNAYLDSLSENARQTLEFEPSALEDDPLVSAMLDFGKLMSFTTAKKSGKVEANSGDYDGQPWLPPSFFSKGAGIMPDQMAQAMFDAGLLPDAYTGTLWSEIGKRIESTRKDKAAHREAVQAYKDAQKAAKAEAKAEAEAWANQARKTAGSPKAQRDMLKGALRTLDGILAAAPPEVRARVGGYVKLASLATDEAMLQEIERRIDKLNVELEKYLKKEYRQQIAKLFKRYAPKKDDKGRITSNITADAAEDIGFAFDFASLDDANQEKEMAALEKTLEESEDSTEIQDAIGKLAIVQLFHKLEERESSELEAAAMWLKEVGGGARETRKIIDAARAEAVKEAKNEAKKDASNGKLSSLPDAENVEADVRSSTFKRFTNDVKGFLNSALFTLGQQLEIVFGQDSRITTEFHRRAVMAANNSTDIKRDIEARRAEFVAKLFGTKSRIQQAGRMGALTVPTASGVIIEAGGKTTTIDVPAEIVLRIIEGTADLKALGFTNQEASTLADAWADNEALPVKRQKRVFKIERRSDGKNTELTMSQDEAIQYLLWSKQKASREQMERDGWSKESFQQLNTFLSDDAKALAGFFADEYARMGRLIEPVYRRMFHAPFPQVTNYSPIFRDISSADSIIDIDQQGHGSGVSSGFILARNKNARSALRRTSAISAFMQHAESAAHWVSHVELVRDMRSVLIDKEVQNAIRSNGRTAAANGIKKRVMQLENQGKVGAAGIAELDSWGAQLLQARAFKGLAWRISPVLKQTSAYFNPLLADVPAWDYMRGTARLLSGKLDVSAMWKSPDIQRRIVMGFSAEARIAMDRLGYTGSTLLAAMGKGMMPMALIDAGWTTAGAAVAFDYYRRNNIKSGMNETQAESAAMDQIEMMIAESAQPADAANRSLIEGLQNPWLKSMWMFASESRKTLAVEIMALRRLATGKSKNKAMDVQRAVVAHVVMATTTQLMAGILSLLMGDDDDREREWSVEEWAAAIAAGPINGLFLFGDAVNYVGRRLFGLHAFEPSTAIGQAVKTVSSAPSNLDKVINGEPEEQRKAFLRLGEAVGQAASLVGPGNPFTATDVILGNPLKDAEKILTRLTD
jgi:hypothetical protein